MKTHDAARLLPIPCALALVGCAGSNAIPGSTIEGPAIERTLTVGGLGAGQSLSCIGPRLYAQGDDDTGVVIELYVDDVPGGGVPTVEPTGRELVLTRRGEDWLPHPTGSAERAGLPWFLGDTVRQKGLIHLIDRERAWSDGHLDAAIKHTVLDDLATNGTRPEWVRYEGRWVIATSDYGPERNELRLYDPDRLAQVSRSSAPGVLVKKWPCGPFVQSIHYIDAIAPDGSRVEGTGTAVLVQNITPGLGYRLTLVDLDAAADMDDLRGLPTIDFAYPTDELEGFAVLPGFEDGEGWAAMLSASREENLHLIRFSLPPRGE